LLQAIFKLGIFTKSGVQQTKYAALNRLEEQFERGELTRHRVSAISLS
jgi:hypothetical protein